MYKLLCLILMIFILCYISQISKTKENYHGSLRSNLHYKVIYIDPKFRTPDPLISSSVGTDDIEEDPKKIWRATITPQLL